MVSSEESIVVRRPKAQLNQNDYQKHYLGHDIDLGDLYQLQTERAVGLVIR